MPNKDDYMKLTKAKLES